MILIAGYDRILHSKCPRETEPGKTIRNGRAIFPLGWSPLRRQVSSARFGSLRSSPGLGERFCGGAGGAWNEYPSLGRIECCLAAYGSLWCAATRIHVAIGLQTRVNPAASRARELILSGAIRRVLSAHVYSSTTGFGPIVPAPYLYLEDPENGVNMVTIQEAHTIDFALCVVGGCAT